MISLQEDKQFSAETFEQSRSDLSSHFHTLGMTEDA